MEPDGAAINREFASDVPNCHEAAPTSVPEALSALAEIWRSARHGIIYARHCLTAGQAFKAGEKSALEWMYVGYTDLLAAADVALAQAAIARNPTADRIWREFESAYAPTAVHARHEISECLRQMHADHIVFEQLPELARECLFVRMAGTTPYGVAVSSRPSFV